MKYLLLLCDGMADYPVDVLNGETPLAYAKKPTMDYLASYGEMGTVKITPTGLTAGSEVGNCMALGYNPLLYGIARAPLEAAALGIDFSDNDTVFRCNFSRLSNDEIYEDRKTLNLNIQDISITQEKEIIALLNSNFSNTPFTFFLGNRCRHCLVIKNFSCEESLMHPQNMINRPIGEFLPKSECLKQVMKKCTDILKYYPINSIWLWGQGKKPSLPLFYEKFNKRGAVVTAVNVIRGIAKLTDMKLYEVTGATGMLDTNYIGKAKAVLQAYQDGYDFCFLHFEATDEYSHMGKIKEKVLSIEMIDKALEIVINALKNKGEPYSILVLPDHPTSVIHKIHTEDDVPYILYNSNSTSFSLRSYSEKSALQTGVYVEKGEQLINKLFGEQS